ncbi:tryptophan-rich sensory protein [Parasphingorhabdus sp.]|jgi:hypothetical protein|uniref:tryptophan-rich sensory protein n=1 Tax=Parasphingorhabdus sp. TaxID=2709688 RepID=UPI0007F44873|nr:hypothetical protein A8B75_03625 [Sphingomonadales bacterium EhC05]
MKAILLLIVTIAFAIVPFLSPEFGGFDPEKYPVPQRNPAVQPAGWAFSIWGLIYLWLIAHAIFGVFKFRQDAQWDKGRMALILSLAIGAIWLPIALLSPIWATLLIWIMLIAALICLYQLNNAAPAWIARWPIALYTGWLSAASFVSIGLLLAGYGLVDEIAAAVIALVLATAFAGYNAYRLKSWPYAAAVAWGFVAIAIANIGSSKNLAIAAAIAAVIVILLSAPKRQTRT